MTSFTFRNLCCWVLQLLLFEVDIDDVDTDDMDTDDEDTDSVDTDDMDRPTTQCSDLSNSKCHSSAINHSLSDLKE